MKIEWKSCLRVGIGVFLLYLAIHYWPGLSGFIGSLLSAAVPLLLGCLIAYLINIPPMPLWQGLLALPSAVTTVVTQERKKGEIEFRCVCLGDISHLLQAKETPSLAGLFPEQYNGFDSTDPSAWPFIPELPIIR